MARVALLEAVKTVFAVAETSDPDTERRARLLLFMAALVELLLVVAGLTVDIVVENAATWVMMVIVGVPAMAATFLLARRGRAAAAAWVLGAFVFAGIVVVAWSEGPNCDRMSVAILAVVAVGAVSSVRLAALVGFGLAAVVTGLGVAEAAGVYAPLYLKTASEAPFAPFVRQSLVLGLMVLLLRRGYDRLQAQVSERERARAAAVTAARTINSSLEALVAERTSTLAATRDRLSALAARLAGDLRSNLATMRRQLDEFATAEAALGDALQPVAKASNAVDRLAVMTQRLHEYAASGTAALRPERVAMDALVRDVVDEYSRAAGAAIDWRIDPLPALWADPALVRTVVENLIGNAIKFSRQRQPPHIHVGHDARGYFVRDNGVGFDPRSAGKLFSAFHRLHLEEDFEGNGLGLANVRRILERSGGDISAEAEPDRGATFRFRLPAEAA